MAVEAGRILQIFRDGRRHEAKKRLQLPTGAQANLETLAVMKQIVREDRQEPDIGAFINQIILGTGKQTLAERIEKAFLFARDSIEYEPEKDGFETVADLWSCMFALKPNQTQPTGDCAIKCVALATILSFLNLNPAFVAIQQIPNADFFNHVFVSAEINGKVTSLDPTPKEFRVGDELTSFARYVYPIF